MNVSDRFVPEHPAFTLPIQTFWSSFCGGTLHNVGTQLLSQELERTIRLWTHRLHWVTKVQQPWPVLELPGDGEVEPPLAHWSDPLALVYFNEVAATP